MKSTPILRRSISHIDSFTDGRLFVDRLERNL